MIAISVGFDGARSRRIHECVVIFHQILRLQSHYVLSCEKSKIAKIPREDDSFNSFHDRHGALEGQGHKAGDEAEGSNTRANLVSSVYSDHTRRSRRSYGSVGWSGCGGGLESGNRWETTRAAD